MVHPVDLRPDATRGASARPRRHRGVRRPRHRRQTGHAEFTVTVDRARLVDELKGTYGTAKPGMMYLGVVTNLRNDGTVPGRLRDQLDLRDVPQKEFFGAFRFRDGSPIQTLGPGLTEQLVFAWQLPESVVKSLQAVTIRVWKKKYTQLMVTYGAKEWIDTDNYGQIVVPVKEST
jgi:hypothetical protein